MTKTKRTSWYSMKGTEIRPSSIEGHVSIMRCGKLVAILPIEKLTDGERESL